jgi:hypothetical protein
MPHLSANFAAQDRISRRRAVCRDLLEHVLGLPWAFVSDDTQLSDFEGLMPFSTMLERIRDRYGVQLADSDLERPLHEVLDRLHVPAQG